MSYKNESLNPPTESDFDLNNVALAFLIVQLCMPIDSGVILAWIPFLLFKINLDWSQKIFEVLCTLAIVQILIYTPTPSLCTCLVLLSPLCLSKTLSD